MRRGKYRHQPSPLRGRLYHGSIGQHSYSLRPRVAHRAALHRCYLRRIETGTHAGVLCFRCGIGTARNERRPLWFQHGLESRKSPLHKQHPLSHLLGPIRMSDFGRNGRIRGAHLRYGRHSSSGQRLRPSFVQRICRGRVQPAHQLWICLQWSGCHDRF